MNPFTRVLVASLCLSPIFLPNARAQTAQPAQTSAAPVSQTSSQPAPDQQKQPARKVWTDDDVGDLRDRSAISTVGAPSSKPANLTGRLAAPTARTKDARWYQDQISKLRAKIPPLDDKIRHLQDALDGKAVNSVRTYGGVRADDWRDQLSRLRKQREDISAKIAALEDEARHNGITPNALP